MPALLEGEGCPSCGKSHDLYLPTEDVTDARGRYAFTCPATGDKAVVIPIPWGEVVKAPPVGAVLIERAYD